MPADSDDIREPHLRSADFLGAFALIESDAGILMVRNRRVIGGRNVEVWDLPGGQVEPGETLPVTLVRELGEELAIEVARVGDFLFYQEGERIVRGVREYVWRSFFFAVSDYRGEPRATDDVLGCRWMPRDAMVRELTAPYHTSFVEWLGGGGTRFECVWED